MVRNVGAQDGCSHGMSDKEVINDLLSSQKMSAEHCNTWANECINHQLKNDFLNILKEEQDIQFELFHEMQQRGWYPTKPARPEDVNNAKEKFQYVLQ